MSKEDDTPGASNVPPRVAVPPAGTAGDAARPPAAGAGYSRRGPTEYAKALFENTKVTPTYVPMPGGLVIMPASRSMALPMPGGPVIMPASRSMALPMQMGRQTRVKTNKVFPRRPAKAPPLQRFAAGSSEAMLAVARKAEELEHECGLLYPSQGLQFGSVRLVAGVPVITQTVKHAQSHAGSMRRRKKRYMGDGFGTVKLSVMMTGHPTRYEPVVIKFVNSTSSEGREDAVDRAVMMTRLNGDPNGMAYEKIHRSRAEGGSGRRRVGIVSSFQGGGDLLTNLNRSTASCYTNRPVDERETDATALVSKLLYQYSRGFVHGDLKPHNIMCADRPDAVRLSLHDKRLSRTKMSMIDFGLSAHAPVRQIDSSRGGSRSFRGTPGYVTPNDFQQRNHSDRTGSNRFDCSFSNDAYATLVIFLFMLPEYLRSDPKDYHTRNGLVTRYENIRFRSAAPARIKALIQPLMDSFTAAPPDASHVSDGTTCSPWVQADAACAARSYEQLRCLPEVANQLLAELQADLREQMVKRGIAADADPLVPGTDEAGEALPAIPEDDEGAPSDAADAAAKPPEDKGEEHDAGCRPAWTVVGEHESDRFGLGELMQACIDCDAAGVVSFEEVAALRDRYNEAVLKQRFADQLNYMRAQATGLLHVDKPADVERLRKFQKMAADLDVLLDTPDITASTLEDELHEVVDSYPDDLVYPEAGRPDHDVAHTAGPSAAADAGVPAGAGHGGGGVPVPGAGLRIDYPRGEGNLGKAEDELACLHALQMLIASTAANATLDAAHRDMLNQLLVRIQHLVVIYTEKIAACFKGDGRVDGRPLAKQLQNVANEWQCLVGQFVLCVTESQWIGWDQVLLAPLFKELGIHEVSYFKPQDRLKLEETSGWRYCGLNASLRDCLYRHLNARFNGENLTIGAQQEGSRTVSVNNFKALQAHVTECDVPQRNEVGEIVFAKGDTAFGQRLLNDVVGGRVDQAAVRAAADAAAPPATGGVMAALGKARAAIAVGWDDAMERLGRGAGADRPRVWHPVMDSSDGGAADKWVASPGAAAGSAMPHGGDDCVRGMLAAGGRAAGSGLGDDTDSAASLDEEGGAPAPPIWR